MAMIIILIVFSCCITSTVTQYLCNGDSGMYYNVTVKDCEPCSKCNQGEVKEKECKNYTNTECRKCSECPPGEYIKENCSTEADTSCDKCRNGTFSNVSDMAKCMPCSNCSGLGFEQLCNATSDAVCKENGNTSVIVVVVVLLLLLVASGVLIYCLRKKKLFCWATSTENDVRYSATPADDTC